MSACSGNYSTGSQPNPLPPNATNAPAIAQTGSASPGPKTAALQTSPGSAVYPLADASNGYDCPDTKEGFACRLRFNVPPPTPTPAPGKKSAKQTPAPTPSPTPSPSPSPAGSPNGAGSASPAASASPATIALHAEALPKGAPPMIRVPRNALNTTALMLVTLSTSTDFTLDGLAIVQFTVPKEQIAGRGFSLQLFLQHTQGKSKSYAPIVSLDKASLDKNTLIFGFTPPKLTVAKGNTYVLVLYANDISQSPAPTSSPSPAPTPTASPTP